MQKQKSQCVHLQRPASETTMSTAGKPRSTTTMQCCLPHCSRHWPPHWSLLCSVRSLLHWSLQTWCNTARRQACIRCGWLHRSTTRASWTTLSSFVDHALLQQSARCALTAFNHDACAVVRVMMQWCCRRACRTFERCYVVALQQLRLVATFELATCNLEPSTIPACKLGRCSLVNSIKFPIYSVQCTRIH
jgi:hypothetical protein